MSVVGVADVRLSRDTPRTCHNHSRGVKTRIARKNRAMILGDIRQNLLGSQVEPIIIDVTCDSVETRVFYYIDVADIPDID